MRSKATPKRHGRKRMLANYLCQDKILKYEIIDVAQLMLSKNKARRCSGEKVIVEEDLKYKKSTGSSRHFPSLVQYRAWV